MPKADPEEDDLWWGKPIDSRRFHIFDGYGPISGSLCGNWQLGHQEAELDVDPESDSYTEGSDCKQCCRNAGLLDGDS